MKNKNHSHRFWTKVLETHADQSHLMMLPPLLKREEEKKEKRSKEN